MSMSDPIADMLTRIRNSILREHDAVSMPSSNTKENIARVLAEEGFIKSYNVETEKVGKKLSIELKYATDGESIIRGIKRVSKPGLRVFKGYKEIQPMLNGQGIYIVSTSNGLLPDITCRNKRIGGEILCEVY